MANNDIRTDSLSRGDDTFTTDRLAFILKNERFSYDHRTDVGARFYSGIIYGPSEIRCEINTDCFEFERVDGGLRCLENDTAKLRATEFCRQLYGHDSPVSISVIDLDAKFSKVFSFKFEPLERSQTIIDQTCSLLERMPAWPPELIDTPIAIPLGYSSSSVADNAQRDVRLWEQLQVTTYVSETVLRAAFSAIMECADASLLDMINIIATLLEIVSQLAPTITNEETAWRSFIIRAFLWTTWQRCQLIYFHEAAKNSLTHGSADGKRGKMALRETMPSPNTTIHEISRRCAGLGKPSYMCGWNFELLRTNSVCIGADFRRFYHLYDAAFGKYSARCLVGQSNACNGDSPHSCQRFHGMVIEDQSAHDQSCSRKCRRLIWDELSYRSLSGARAVCLLQGDGFTDEFMQYCNASDKTLAISHVWSHGQGGRPETGFNHCLHLRYSRIARLSNCDSYWIDAICIPDDHQLREEAIMNINEIFMNAKVMLVCDRDIMKINVSKMTTSVCETLLVTTLVSDWNCRAWTFFEAFRARRAIHLLGQNNVIVSLKQVIQNVCQNGILEVEILFLAMPHFLPPLDDSILAEEKTGDRQKFLAGYLPIETSGNLLSHRPASRPGDDVVIWSLLMSESTVFHDAETLWKTLQGPILESSKETGRLFSRGATIRTGYLISSAPRLKTKGLGWAPASPTFGFSSHSATDSFNSFDGGESWLGWITPDGLVADWFFWKFDSTTLLQPLGAKWLRNLSRIRAQFLQGYRWGAILCPIEERGYNPNSEPSGSWWEDGGRKRRTIIAVCGINDRDGTVAAKYTWNSTEPAKPKWDQNNDAVGWEWKGVYAWDDIEPIPEMQKVLKFLIV